MHGIVAGFGWEEATIGSILGAIFAAGGQRRQRVGFSRHCGFRDGALTASHPIMIACLRYYRFAIRLGIFAFVSCLK